MQLADNVTPTPSPSAQPRPMTADEVLAEWRASMKDTRPGAAQSALNPVLGAYPFASWPVFIAYAPSNRGHGGPVTKTIADMEREFWSMSDADFEKLRDRLLTAGLLQSPQATRTDVWAAWANILGEAAKGYASDVLVTPYQILSRYEKKPISQDKTGLPDQYTTTNRTINVTDPVQASDLLTRALQDALGRNPSPAEKQGFLAALNAAERANPTVTTTAYKKNASGQYDTSITTTGGIEGASFAQDFALSHNESEAGAYQAATTYMAALLQALGAPV